VKLRFGIAAALYCALLLAFSEAAKFFRVDIPFAATLVSFALLLALFRFFPFGFAVVVVSMIFSFLSAAKDLLPATPHRLK
jgi:hypothetical protein